MIVYCGWLRETEVVSEVVDLGCGAGLTVCLECEGSGVFIGHPEIAELPCVPCKGVGKIYVSI